MISRVTYLLVICLLQSYVEPETLRGVSKNVIFAVVRDHGDSFLSRCQILGITSFKDLLFVLPVRQR